MISNIFIGVILMDEKKIELLANTKSYLEKRIKELHEELAFLESLLELVNENLSKKSFVTATQITSKEKKEEITPLRKEKIGEKVLEINITSRTGEILAILEAYENIAIVKPLVNLNITTQPFKAFLINRILEGFKRKDEERVLKGEIQENEAFNYEIVTEDDSLKEIRMYNYRTKDRLFELRGAIRWTFSRMLEK